MSNIDVEVKYKDYISDYENYKKIARNKEELTEIENMYIKLGFVQPHIDRIQRNEYTDEQINRLIDIGVLPKDIKQIERLRQEIRLRFQHRIDYIKARVLLENNFIYKDNGEYPIIEYDVIKTKSYFERNKEYITGLIVGFVMILIFRLILSIIKAY